MKTIKTLKTLPPVYKTDDDGNVEELTVHFRKYPTDSKHHFSIAVERSVYGRDTIGRVMEVVFGPKQKLELTQTKVPKNTSLASALDAATTSAMYIAEQEGYSTTPPAWFRNHLLTLEPV